MPALDVNVIAPSGSTNGRMVKVVQTATAGTLLHTCTATANEYDCVTIWAVNNHTAAVDLTIELGGVTSPDDLVIYSGLRSKVGEVKIVDQARLQGGVAVRAFCSVANVVSCRISVDRYEADTP